jgi:hypothetical protein
MQEFIMNKRRRNLFLILYRSELVSEDVPEEDAGEAVEGAGDENVRFAFCTFSSPSPLSNDPSGNDV